MSSRGIDEQPNLVDGRLLVALLMAFLFVLLHDGSRCNFLGALPVTSRFLGTLFDVFVLSLLFGTYST